MQLDQVRREALAFACIGLYRFRLDGTVVFMDACALRIFELTDRFPEPASVVGLKISDLVTYLTPVGSMRRELQEHGKLRGWEWHFSTLAGTLKWVVEDSYLVHDSDLNEDVIQVIVRDVTETRKTRQDLQESEARYREILENIQEGYYEVDLKGNLTYFNDALCRIFGYAPEELRGMNYRQYYRDPGAIERAYTTYRHVYETGEAIQVIDWAIRRKDEATAIVEVSIALVVDAEGERCGFRGIVRDVTARKEAERRLRAAEARYRELFENANDVVYTHDMQGILTSINRKGEEITGRPREEMLGRSVLDFVSPDCRPSIEGMFYKRLSKKEPIARFESAIQSHDGKRVPVEIIARLIFDGDVAVGVQGTARDIRERKAAERERAQLQAQIQHTQKLESLGVLAGGIAHDFNNLLVGVLGNAGLALARLPEDSPARPYLRKIEAAAQRAAALTNQMLAYAGKGAISIHPIHLSTLAGEMGQLLTTSISKDATLKYEFEPDLPLIRGDVAQLHQVIMNLVTNASDALENRPGTITVRTFSRDLDHPYLSKTYLQDDLPAGLYACVEVEDTGCGMTEDTIARIFDPFFTTKFAGRGLGLAAVLGIVRAHHGAVSVQSAPGKGTRFRVLFPALPHESHAEPEQGGEPEPEKASFWRGQGLVLVADDEVQVREVAREILDLHGFKVLCAEDGAEMLRLYSENKDIVAAVVLDLTMPEMDGRQVFRQIREENATLPVVLSSGYTKQDVDTQLDNSGWTAFVQKPYLPHELVNALRRTIEPS